MRIVVIGAGAAGFFAAISARTHHPGAQVLLLEKSDKTLSKVRISGGGRCNVTHRAMDERRFAAQYPRGGGFLKKAFKFFGPKDTVAWFQERGVELKTEADGRMFPVTDDSATIVQCLQDEASRSGVELRMREGVPGITRGANGFQLSFADGRTLHADRVIVATGGHPKPEGSEWLAKLGHRIVPPVPSLFTFNMPDDPIRSLTGVVADPVRARIAGTRLESTGPLLITHWGMSGPAILRLSAWGARTIHAMAYRFEARINWTGGLPETEVRERLRSVQATDARKQMANRKPFDMPKRLWHHLLEKAGINREKPWGELPRKERDRLVDLLTNDKYDVRGRTTNKEEFVTAGGVDTSEVDPLTMRSLLVPGLHFAGEVLDIDGITGGFNFQAAWTTGFLAGRASGDPLE